jgi:hypothetical protein
MAKDHHNVVKTAIKSATKSRGQLALPKLVITLKGRLVPMILPAAAAASRI